jgi:hypothetical protein
MEQLFQYLVTVSSLLSRLFVAVQILCEIWTHKLIMNDIYCDNSLL